MMRTLIIHGPMEGPVLVAVRQMSLILGPCKICPASDFKPGMNEGYGFFVLAGQPASFQAGGPLSEFISSNRTWLARSHAALVGIGTEIPVTDGVLREAGAALGGIDLLIEPLGMGANGADLGELVNCALRIRAARLKYMKAMPRDEIRKRIETVLSSELYLILCTASGASVRGTTIGYTYKDGFVYAFCEGSEKYANLLRNPEISLALYTMPEKVGLQISGSATIAYPGTDEYRDMCQLLKRDHKRYMGLPFQLVGIIIKLHKAEYYLARLKDEGYYTKQVYYF